MIEDVCELAIAVSLVTVCELVTAAQELVNAEDMGSPRA